MEFLIGAAAFLAAVSVLFFLVRAVARALFGRSRRLERDLAADVLRHRLARGEITPAQFREAMTTIGDG